MLNSMRWWWTQIRRTLDMIKFEHSVFALPFALLGALLGARGWPSAHALLWIVVAMIGARSAAMTFNRIADRKLDANNPRTRLRALPAGLLSLRFAVVFFLASAAVFELAAWQLNRLAFELSLPALACITLYSYTKRFTWLSHWALGLAMGIAPAAAWIAVRGSFSPTILPLSGAVMLWGAGFDILYACQDYDFDRERSDLYSLPKRLGIARSLHVAQACHLLMLALLVELLRLHPLGALGWLGLAMVALLLAWEHSLVRPDDLSKINAAFFTVNGYVGLLLLLVWGAAIIRRH